MAVPDRVLAVVRELPGANAQDIVELLSDANEITVRSALSMLAKERKLTRSPVRHHTPHGPRKSYAYRLANPSASAPTPPTVSVKPPRVSHRGELASLKGRLAAAEEEMAALRQWKAEALERYPDLRVKPEVLEARKIVAREILQSGDATRANDVTAGKSDGSMIMRAVVAALEARA